MAEEEFEGIQRWTARRRGYKHLPLRTPNIYKIVRHPVYVGWMIAFWVTPAMIVGHLLFAGGMTAYMVLAIPFEERDLVDLYSEPFENYRRKVPALVPRIARGKSLTADEMSA